jgi:hypothetical protein
MLISGYAGFKGMGWNTNCPIETELVEGINLVSLTGPISSVDGGCDTYHHFTVYVLGNYSIIFDSWAGGDDGCREPWIRIMQTDDLQNLFHQINTYPNSHDFLTEVFKNYFNAPNKQGKLTVDYYVQVGILNSKSGLDDSFWKYLYGMQKGHPSKLSRRSTIETLKQFDFPVIIPSPSSSPPPSPRRTHKKKILKRNARGIIYTFKKRRKSRRNRSRKKKI